MNGNRSPEIPKSGVEAHKTVLARSKQAEKQLADVGIKLAGYRSSSRVRSESGIAFGDG